MDHEAQWKRCCLLHVPVAKISTKTLYSLKVVFTFLLTTVCAVCTMEMEQGDCTGWSCSSSNPDTFVRRIAARAITATFPNKRSY